MVKRRGDAKGRSTAAKSTKIGRRAKESEYEQDNLDRQDEDVEEEEKDDR
ncbi:hypothetical protein RhiirA5_447068 [Rhizophagus irregularis]|uniref:Uncharacterized protein n=1 Tax=Rhizophagus irregularis TaxID=588596 RepID=A0A2N0NBE3_9GLOM|nr:hypothetical protein RhiirA5_447068 [Rhizophagus irregularis]